MKDLLIFLTALGIAAVAAALVRQALMIRSRARARRRWEGKR